MKTFLAIKQTDEEKKSNETVRFNFILAIMNLDDKAIAEMLDNNTICLNNKNKWQTVFWFKNQFKKVASNYQVNLIEGISLDVYPGSEMLEFIFQKESENYSPFEEISNENKKNKVKIRLVLSYNQGYIIDIKIPKKFIEKNKLHRLEICN